MSLYVEMLVLHPIGVINIKWQTIEPPLENRRDMQPPSDMLDNILEPHRFPSSDRRIIDIDSHDMRQVFRRLDIEELGVLGAKLMQHIVFLYIAWLTRISCRQGPELQAGIFPFAATKPLTCVSNTVAQRHLLYLSIL